MRKFLRSLVWINWFIVALAVSAIVAGLLGAFLVGIIVLAVSTVANIYGGPR